MDYCINKLILGKKKETINNKVTDLHDNSIKSIDFQNIGI